VAEREDYTRPGPIRTPVTPLPLPPSRPPPRDVSPTFPEPPDPADTPPPRFDPRPAPPPEVVVPGVTISAPRPSFAEQRRRRTKRDVRLLAALAWRTIQNAIRGPLAAAARVVKAGTKAKKAERKAREKRKGSINLEDLRRAAREAQVLGRAPPPPVRTPPRASPPRRGAAAAAAGALGSLLRTPGGRPKPPLPIPAKSGETPGIGAQGKNPLLKSATPKAKVPEKVARPAPVSAATIPRPATRLPQPRSAARAPRPRPASSPLFRVSVRPRIPARPRPVRLTNPLSAPVQRALLTASKAGVLTLPGGGSTPPPRQPTQRDKCKPCPKPKEKKPRTTCYRGYFREYEKSERKVRWEKVPCRQSK